MKILFTNNTLATRAGTELYIRDLAFALSKRGHQVAAYSNILGEVAEELMEFGVPVSDDLSGIPFRPDILHGHHHLETMTALRRFSGVPAVYFCHGWRPWQEIPPRHPRIMEYAAVDLVTMRHAVQHHAVPENRIRLMSNFVDLDRFQPRGPLPILPRRALIFSNYAREDFHVPPIREACQKAGLALELAGSGVGRPVARPEELLGPFDIVFAKGRCALEALATGAAVIILYEAGLGCLVQSKDLTRTLQLNFGSNGNLAPLACQNVLSEIAKYDPEDAARVSQKVREECGLAGYLDRLLFFYTGALERYDRISISHEEEASAEADYLKKISHLVKEQFENIANLGHLLQQKSDAAEQAAARIHQLEMEVTQAKRNRSYWENLLQQKSEAADKTATRINELEKELIQVKRNLREAQGCLTIRFRDFLLRVPPFRSFCKIIIPMMKKPIDG